MPLFNPSAAATAAILATGYPLDQLALKAANFDPIFANGLTGALTSGRTYYQRLPIPHATPISNLIFRLWVGGSALTSSQCFAGVYSSAGTLLAKSADLSTTFASSGLKTVALIPEAGQSLPVGGPGVWVRTCLLFNGTTPPNILKTSSSVDGTIMDVGQSGTACRFSVDTTGRTAIQATDQGSTQETVATIWVGAS